MAAAHAWRCPSRTLGSTLSSLSRSARIPATSSHVRRRRQSLHRAGTAQRSRRPHACSSPRPDRVACCGATTRHALRCTASREQSPTHWDSGDRRRPRSRLNLSSEFALFPGPARPLSRSRRRCCAGGRRGARWPALRRHTTRAKLRPRRVVEVRLHPFDRLTRGLHGLGGSDAPGSGGVQLAPVRSCLCEESFAIRSCSFSAALARAASEIAACSANSA